MTRHLLGLTICNLLACNNSDDTGLDYSATDGSYTGDLELILEFPDRGGERSKCLGTATLEYLDGVGTGTANCTFDGLMEGETATGTIWASEVSGDLRGHGFNGEIVFAQALIPISTNADGTNALGAADNTVSVVVDVFGQAFVRGGYNIGRAD